MAQSIVRVQALEGQPADMDMALNITMSEIMHILKTGSDKVFVFDIDNMPGWVVRLAVDVAEAPVAPPVTDMLLAPVTAGVQVNTSAPSLDVQTAPEPEPEAVVPTPAPESGEATDPANPQ